MRMRIIDTRLCMLVAGFTLLTGAAFAQTLKSAAHRRLAQEATPGGSRDVSFFQEREQRVEAIEVGSIYMLVGHVWHYNNALDKSLTPRASSAIEDSASRRRWLSPSRLTGQRTT